MTMVEIVSGGAQDAASSIVLLGNRRTGKSTLAVIASAALGRRLVDFDAFFRQRTGLRRRDYKQQRGAADFSSRQASLFRELLWSNEKGCIIVCPADHLQSSERRLLKLFAQTHPVIEIVSDLQQADDDPHPEPSESGSRELKSCSNFEYFNLCEGHLNAGSNTPPRPDGSGSSFLRLKRVEQDFLAFLKRVRRRVADADHVTTAQSQFTYALTLHLSTLLKIEALEGALCDGTDAVEIRIDLSDPQWTQSSSTEFFRSVSRAITLVRRAFRGPVIYHVLKPCSWPQRSGVGSSWANTYVDLLHQGLRLCPDYLTVDLSFDDKVLQDVVASRGSTRIMGHYHHDDSSGPDNWGSAGRMDHFNRAISLGCSLVRLTQAAQSVADNISAQQFSCQADGAGGVPTRLIAYNTGPRGRLSCCLNSLYTPVCLPSCHKPGLEALGPASPEDPQLTLRDAQTALYSAFVLDEMHLFSIGTDVSGSLSPAMYRAAFRHLGMPHTCTPRSMASIVELKELIADDHFGGSAIAQGHKMTVLPYVSQLSPHAKIIGAVNTLIPIRCTWRPGEPAPLRFWRERNQAGPIEGLYGENTDWIGVHQSIAKRLSPVNAVNAKTTGLVMGAGGMARAAIYAMIQLGVRHIFVCNRTVANARRLADHYHKLTVMDDGLLDKGGNRAPLSSGTRQGWLGHARVMVIESLEHPWPAGFAYPTMIVCCVRAPLEAGKPQPVVTIPPQWLKSPNGGVVIETSYDTLLSPLIRQMRGLTHKGWVVVDGLHLLPEQAAAQFELFTGRKSPYIRMCIEVLRNYQSEPDEETQEEIKIRLAELYGRLGHIPE